MLPEVEIRFQGKFGLEAARVTRDQNKLVVRRYLEEVVNTGNVDNIAEFISPDYVEVYLNTRYAIGLEGARNHVLGVRQIYPYLQVTVEQQIAEREWVATRITAKGTQQGSWLGIRPTGKVVEVTGINMDRVVDGRIVEHGGAANFLEPLLKVGAICATDPGPESDAESERCTE